MPLITKSEFLSVRASGNEPTKQPHHFNLLLATGKMMTMIRNRAGEISQYSNGTYLSFRNARAETLIYFVLAVLGFSFWFLMAVPFASHRESYEWLAMVYSQDFTDILFFTATTFRPLAQVATWLGFSILDPTIFPTSALRQAFLQGSIYAMFVLAWALIYSAVFQRRLYALGAFVTGGVFFSGYVQLFHIYGVFYVPIMLTLGALLRLHTARTFDKREIWFATAASLLALWHPFATALFLGFYFGFYLDTFRQRSRSQHIQATIILLLCMTAIVVLVVLGSRAGSMSLHARLFGFLVSYQTNEINLIASFTAWVMTQMVALSMGISHRLKIVAALFVSLISIVFLLAGVPVLFVWLGAALIKVLYLRCWSLFFLLLTAILLPFGKGIGTPIYGLFAIVVAVYVTPFGWVEAEKVLSLFKKRYAVGIAITLMIVLLMVRMGIKVPIVTRVASPLLVERERTYQLEYVLAWLRKSDYCGYEIAFTELAGNPIDSVESAIIRRNRPPAALRDVQFFWKSVLQCQGAEPPNSRSGTVIVTFGGSALADGTRVFEVAGRYAGDAVVWIENLKTK